MTCFRMILEASGVDVLLNWSDSLSDVERGVNSGKVGLAGSMSMCESWGLFRPTVAGMTACRGAVKGLYAALWEESLCLLWSSLAIASAGRRMGAGGGVDSFSRNFTNSSEND